MRHLSRMLRSRWSKGRGPRGTRASKARTGHRVGLVDLLLLRGAPVSFPQHRSLRSRARAHIPRQTTQSGRARKPPVLLRSIAWGARGAVPRTPALMCPVVGPVVKPVGEPDAGDWHVRFDERGWETERWPLAPSYRAHPQIGRAHV